MNIQTKKIIPDLRVFEAADVSRDYGRSRLRDLETKGTIKPLKTPTGRCLLSINDAKVLVDAL